MEKTEGKKIVVLGGGFGGAYAFKALHRQWHGDPTVELALVNGRNYFLFTPLLHEVATGGVAAPLVTEPLRSVLGCCLRDFHLAEVESIDLNKRRVFTTRKDIEYDYLVVALGATTDFFDVPGASQHTFTLKSLDDAVRMKNHLISQFECAAQETDRAKRKKMLRFVVVGGGPTGVELAAEIADLCLGTMSKLYGRSSLLEDVQVVLLEAGSLLMAQMPEQMSEVSVRILRNKGVVVHLDTRVKQVGDGFVVLTDGTRLASDTVVWVAGVKPQPVEVVGDAPRDERGRLMVTATMQLEKYPEVFVLGDMARFMNVGESKPAPALAQVASKQGPAVASNITRLVQGDVTKTYRYKHAGELVSLGQWMAVGSVKNLFFTGRFAWWVWRTVYLFKLLSWRKRLKVAIDWTWDLFSPRDISQM